MRAYWTACSGRRPRGPTRPRAGAAVPDDVLGLRAARGGGESVATARGVHLPFLLRGRVLLAGVWSAVLPGTTDVTFPQRWCAPHFECRESGPETLQRWWRPVLSSAGAGHEALQMGADGVGLLQPGFVARALDAYQG